MSGSWHHPYWTVDQDGTVSNLWYRNWCHKFARSDKCDNLAGTCYRPHINYIAPGDTDPELPDWVTHRTQPDPRPPRKTGSPGRGHPDSSRPAPAAATPAKAALRPAAAPVATPMPMSFADAFQAANLYLLIHMQVSAAAPAALSRAPNFGELDVKIEPYDCICKHCLQSHGCHNCPGKDTPMTG